MSRTALIRHQSLALYFLVLYGLMAASCSRSHGKSSNALFRSLPASFTGIGFKNEVREDEEVNPLQYENSYNGGGVAIGDFNRDGLEDIYFSANQADNRLYLNLGGFHFRDITYISQVQGHNGWKTGVTVADVNGDGWPDIYVNYSGNFRGPARTNELFINKGLNKEGIPVFKEEAAQYGLNDSSFSTQAVFFDYDRDGDLDLLLLNHCPIRFNNLDQSSISYLLQKSDSLAGTKLYRNDNGYFHNVSRQAGIRMCRLNYSLGASVSDINGDGWPDIYISNDYLAPDYLYINNHDGTFTDRTDSMLTCTSLFSMGNDIADINNDGRPDILTLDMLPEDNRRQKLLFGSDNFEYFELLKNSGLHAQYMRNMLHLNNGNGTFSEIGRLSGISNTDWSWAGLFFDADNDGWKDLFITNGYLRDYTNMDFLKYMGDYLRDREGKIQKANLLELVRKMPSSRVRNYAFKNRGDLTFKDVSASWGLNASTNSNGAAYADFDNDGDLDLVVNNLNEEALVYQNLSRETGQNAFLSVKLQGDKKNSLGVGAAITLYCSGAKYYQEQLLQRGFQSSVSATLVFGLGSARQVDSLLIRWPSGKTQRIKSLLVNRQVLLREADATWEPAPVAAPPKTLFRELRPPIDFVHKDSETEDFKRQPLLPAALSSMGPCIAVGDVNRDGREDVYVGAGYLQKRKLFIQQPNHTFIAREAGLENDSIYNDTDAAFVDVDRDGDLDLVVCSGGYNNFSPSDKSIQTRLYLNDGKDHFTRSANAFPVFSSSASCITVADINKDGYPDLFIGGRVVPGLYPQTPESYILINNGNGTFRNVTDSVANGLRYAGMVTTARFADLNQDGWMDLVVAGEWMPIQIWINDHGKLKNRTGEYFDQDYFGWWNKIEIADINGDGKPDLIAGNAGLNLPCKPTQQQPAELYYKDFDNNGSLDPFFCFYIQGKTYPFVSRDELLDQISSMRSRFTSYQQYCNATLSDIFTPEELKDAKVLHATNFKTTCFISTSSGRFKEIPLPVEAQFAPVFAITVRDVNGDGYADMVLAGNITYSRIKVGLNRSNYGLILLGGPEQSFHAVPATQAGMILKGDVRSLSWINEDVLLVGFNNDRLRAYKMHTK